MQEELLLIFSKVSRITSVQLSSKCLIERGYCDGKGQGLNHVLNEAEICHLVKDSSKFHKYFLWLDAVAEVCDNLVKFVLIYFFLGVVKSLYKPPHDISEVFFILCTEHADEVDNFLDQLWILEIDVFYQSHENVFVVIYQVVVEVFEKHDIPINHNFSSIGVILGLLQKQRIQFDYEKSLTILLLSPLNSFLSFLKMFSKSFLSLMISRTSLSTFLLISCTRS